MILKLFASFIIFIIAIIEKFWSKEISKRKKVKWIFFSLLVLSLAFSFFTIIWDDIDTTANLTKQRELQNALVKKNDSLKIQIDSLMKLTQANEINSGNRSVVLQAKISDLNDKLEPFIKLAVKKYPEMKIEDALEKLQNDIIETKKLAQPNTIRFQKKEVNSIENGYSVKLYFTTTKNETLGYIAIQASILGVGSSKILDIWPTLEGGPFTTGPDSKLISPNGKQGRIVYSIIGMGRPVIEIKVSSKCRLYIEGNNELPSFYLDI